MNRRPEKELEGVPFGPALQPEKIDQAWHYIKNAQRITLLSHKGADADAICSSMALSRLLEALGKKVETVFPDKPKVKVIFKPAGLLIGRYAQVPDLVICLDVAEPDRMYLPAAFRDIPLINIDHHRGNTVGGVIDLVAADASSTCEVLTGLICLWHEADRINVAIAEALLCGILDDSIIFRTQLSTTKTLLASAFLIAKGADFQKVKNIVLTYKNPFVAKFWGCILSKIKIVSKWSLSLAMVTKKELQNAGVDEAALGGFVNFLAGVVNSDIVVLLVERDKGIIKGSMRSKETDVARIAEKLGGGGHMHAAGFELHADMSAAEKALVQAF